MKQQPDKIFHKKLEHYSRPAPELAWDRIESGLNKKRFVYWKLAAAASVVLLLGVGYILMRNETVTTVETQVAKQEVTPKHEEENSKSDLPGTITKEEEKEAQLAQVESSKPLQEVKDDVPHSARKRVRENSSKSKENDFTEIEPNVKDEAIPTAIKNPSNESHIANTPTITDNSSNPEEPQMTNHQQVYAAASKESIVLVLTSSDTKEYLIKNDDDDATSDSKKSSTLKRMLKKASELKTNQDPFGDLRQMKNEILALNFKSDKQREQKK